MRVLNLSGGVSQNASKQTTERLKHYFADHQLTCGIFESNNPEFERLAHQQGIETVFYGPSATDRFERVSLLPGEGYPRAAEHALRACSEYDLVHVYGGPLLHGPIGVLYTMLNQCPLITRFNGYVPLPDSKVKRMIVENVVSQLLSNSQVVFNSHAQKEDTLSTYGVTDSNHINVIPPGVNQEAFHPVGETQDLARSVGINPGTKVVGSVITPRPVKRLDRAFEIIATVARNVNVNYVILGESKYISEYQELAAQKGIADRVHWAGYHAEDELAEWYSLFDATILTSEWESFGMSITESYLCKTPCVAFDVGGMSDQIVDEKTGYLVEPYDVAAFADSLETLLVDTELASTFGTAGQKYVRNRFTLETVSKQYNKIVNSLA